MLRPIYMKHVTWAPGNNVRPLDGGVNDILFSFSALRTQRYVTVPECHWWRAAPVLQRPTDSLLLLFSPVNHRAAATQPRTGWGRRAVQSALLCFSTFLQCDATSNHLPALRFLRPDSISTPRFHFTGGLIYSRGLCLFYINPLLTPLSPNHVDRGV